MQSGSSEWLQQDVNDIDPKARAFLEQYSGIAPGDVVSHVLAVRQRAFALYPWPCIGQLRFLRFSFASYSAYPLLIDRLRGNESFQMLDLGCCFGQDIRKAFADGVRPSQLVGLDLVPEFNALGYELFRDADKLSFEFQTRDILDDAADWTPLESRFDVIHMTSFLHIWNWDGQIKAATRIASFSKIGTVIVGSGLGSVVSGEFPTIDDGKTNYRQSEDSFVRFWIEVGRLSDTKWNVKPKFQFLEATKMNVHQKWAEPNMGILTFEVTRLK